MKFSKKLLKIRSKGFLFQKIDNIKLIVLMNKFKKYMSYVHFSISKYRMNVKHSNRMELRDQKRRERKRGDGSV